MCHGVVTVILAPCGERDLALANRDCSWLEFEEFEEFSCYDLANYHN